MGVSYLFGEAVSLSLCAERVILVRIEEIVHRLALLVDISRLFQHVDQVFWDWRIVHLQAGLVDFRFGRGWVTAVYSI